MGAVNRQQRKALSSHAAVRRDIMTISVDPFRIWIAIRLTYFREISIGQGRNSWLFAITGDGEVTVVATMRNGPFIAKGGPQCQLLRTTLTRNSRTAN